MFGITPQTGDVFPRNQAEAEHISIGLAHQYTFCDNRPNDAHNIYQRLMKAGSEQASLCMADLYMQQCGKENFAFAIYQQLLNDGNPKVVASMIDCAYAVMSTVKYALNSVEIGSDQSSIDDITESSFTTSSSSQSENDEAISEKTDSETRSAIATTFKVLINARGRVSSKESCSSGASLFDSPSCPASSYSFSDSASDCASDDAHFSSEEMIS